MPVFPGRSLRTFYHGTSTVYLPEILTSGLRPGDGREGQIWLTTDLNQAYAWAWMRVTNLAWRHLPAGEPVALQVRVKPRNVEHRDRDVYIYYGVILPQHLKRLPVKPLSAFETGPTPTGSTADWCPECGTRLAHEGRCVYCPGCGWSSCRRHRSA